jgi:hypothetical protein
MLTLADGKVGCWPAAVAAPIRMTTLWGVDLAINAVAPAIPGLRQPGRSCSELRAAEQCYLQKDHSQDDGKIVALAGAYDCRTTNVVFFYTATRRTARSNRRSANCGHVLPAAEPEGFERIHLAIGQAGRYVIFGSHRSLGRRRTKAC